MIKAVIENLPTVDGRQAYRGLTAIRHCEEPAWLKSNVEPLLVDCCRVLRSWRLPHNWSRLDWKDEIQEWKYGSRFLPILSETPLSGDLPGCVETRLGWEFTSDDTYTAIILREAMSGLPDDFRFIVVELFWRGRTEAELGANLGLSRTMVSERKQSALKMLRQILSLRPAVC